MDSLIHAEHITLGYNNKKVFDNASVTFPFGCIGLLGENGAGKTTFIKAVMNFISLSKGNITVKGINAAKDPVSVKRNIGYMPELDMYIPGMSAVAFISYCGYLSGMPISESKSRAHRVLNYVGLDQERYRDIAAFSTGMKQKIKMAQALIHDPDLLILDEPTSGLDPDSRKEMLQLIHDLYTHKKKNIIFSTHIIKDIENLCPHIIMVHNGQFSIRSKIEINKDTHRYIIAAEGNTKDFIQWCTDQKILLDYTSDQHFIVQIHDKITISDLWKQAHSSDVVFRKFVPDIISFEQEYIKTIEAAENNADF